MNEKIRNTLYCSFCGKSQHEVEKLIAGAAVFICDECVGGCNEILAGERMLAAYFPAESFSRDEIRAFLKEYPMSAQELLSKAFGISMQETVYDDGSAEGVINRIFVVINEHMRSSASPDRLDKMIAKIGIELDELKMRSGEFTAMAEKIEEQIAAKTNQLMSLLDQKDERSKETK